MAKFSVKLKNSREFSTTEDFTYDFIDSEQAVFTYGERKNKLIQRTIKPEKVVFKVENPPIAPYEPAKDREGNVLPSKAEYDRKVNEAYYAPMTTEERFEAIYNLEERPKRFAEDLHPDYYYGEAKLETHDSYKRWNESITTRKQKEAYPYAKELKKSGHSITTASKLIGTSKTTAYRAINNNTNRAVRLGLQSVAQSTYDSPTNRLKDLIKEANECDDLDKALLMMNQAIDMAVYYRPDLNKYSDEMMERTKSLRKNSKYYFPFGRDTFFDVFKKYPLDFIIADPNSKIDELECMQLLDELELKADNKCQYEIRQHHKTYKHLTYAELKESENRWINHTMFRYTVHLTQEELWRWKAFDDWKFIDSYLFTGWLPKEKTNGHFPYIKDRSFLVRLVTLKNLIAWKFILRCRDRATWEDYMDKWYHYMDTPKRCIDRINKMNAESLYENETFSDVVNTLKAQGLKQHQVANLIQLSTGQLSSYVTGKKQPPLYVTLALKAIRDMNVNGALSILYNLGARLNQLDQRNPIGMKKALMGIANMYNDYSYLISNKYLKPLKNKFLSVLRQHLGITKITDDLGAKILNAQFRFVGMLEHFVFMRKPKGLLARQISDENQKKKDERKHISKFYLHDTLTDRWYEPSEFLL